MSSPTMPVTDQLREILQVNALCEIQAWFADRGINPEDVLAKYNSDGTLKEPPAVPTDERSRWQKLNLLKFEYDGVRVHRICHFVMETQLEHWRNNPYRLPVFYYVATFLMLMVQPFGLIVMYLVEAKDHIGAGEENVLMPMMRGLWGLFRLWLC
ncbi:hypothetical protein N0V83_005047 [Neocucurbitaria cava]|uniref:Uncharacterized protein n=1 Tax=Neocucurbitaria cava TaxID=798079 RepID=A0A9W9CM57_9PLEO|nr:hypothetical protein N0V83_005047 [Neocucurbitaria cava]